MRTPKISYRATLGSQVLHAQAITAFVGSGGTTL